MQEPQESQAVDPAVGRAPLGLMRLKACPEERLNERLESLRARLEERSNQHLRSEAEEHCSRTGCWQGCTGS